MMSYNQRFPKQWSILTETIDFTDKTIIDAGCGYGDMVKALCRAGAEYIFAYDIDKSLCDRLQSLKLDRACIGHDDINGWKCNEIDFRPVDYLICFSVLPYLDNPRESLKVFRCYAKAVLVECQYCGDGPGLEQIKNDEDMTVFLHRAGFKNVVRLGATKVKNRGVERTIWKCS